MISPFPPAPNLLHLIPCLEPGPAGISFLFVLIPILNAIPPPMNFTPPSQT